MTPTEIEKLKELDLIAALEAAQERAGEAFRIGVDWQTKANEAVSALEAKDAEIERLTKPRYITEWAEDMGDVLWWHYPIQEAPYVGTPNDTEFQHRWHTWWTPLPDPARVNAAFGKRADAANEARALLSKQDSGERP